MIELTKWWQTVREQFADEWLVLGKGPTLADYQPERDSRPTIGLNHVVRKYNVDIAHVIDVDVISACENILVDQCRYLLMPLIPNVNCQPGVRPLEQYFEILPVLKTLSDLDRLVWYWLITPYHQELKPDANSPGIRAINFSAEAVLNILGELGVGKVRSYGIDGGRSYAAQFQRLAERTLLANGLSDFDSQFVEMRKTAQRFRIDYQPMTEPMKVFVGTDDSQMVAAKALEYSIHKHASRSVEVIHMLNLDYPELTNPSIRPGTNFSFARFKIPELAGYSGRALYCDADMQVFGDVAELWDIPFGDQTVLCTRQDNIPDVWKDNPAFAPGRQMSVMLLDCSRLDWNIDTIIDGLNRERYTYKELMTELCIVPPEQIRDGMSPAWNCLEHFEEGNSKLVHYTNVPTQPWKVDSNPLGDLWMDGFRDAVQNGIVTLDLLISGVLSGHIREELLQEARTLLPEEECGSDMRLEAARSQLWDALEIISQQKIEIDNLTERLKPVTRTSRLIKYLKKLTGNSSN